MVKMIATKAHTYGRKTIEAGEEFEVEDAYVPTLQSLGRATLKDAPTKTRPMTTQPPQDKPHGQAKSSEGKTQDEAKSSGKSADDKGKYPTRQMKADE